MKKLSIVVFAVAIVVLMSGCSSHAFTQKKPFLLDGCTYSIHKDATPIMKKMENLQRKANGGEEPEEIYVMSLYVKADENENDKITRREAKRAYERYLAEVKVAVGALPFQLPIPK